MNILVVGGAGFIGTHTIKALQRSNHTVTLFDSFEHGYEPAAHMLLDKKSIYTGNILNSNDLGNVFKNNTFDAVIHFAAYIEAGESVTSPAKFFTNNTAGSFSLFQTMLDYGVHNLVFSSTAAVYGQPKTVPIPETASKKPTNPYGTSKYLVEQALADLCANTPLKATILRFFNAAGADPEGQLGEFHDPETHLIPLVLQVAQGKRESIKIFGADYPTPDGTAVRDYIHVDDLANAHVMALETAKDTSEPLRTYNVGTGRGYSVLEVIESVRKVTGHPIPAEQHPRRAGDPAELVANSSKIQSELGWAPKSSDLETIVTHAWQWLKSHPQGYNIKSSEKG